MPSLWRIVWGITKADPRWAMVMAWRTARHPLAMGMWWALCWAHHRNAEWNLYTWGGAEPEWFKRVEVVK